MDGLLANVRAGRQALAYPRSAGVPARDPTDANGPVPGRWFWHEQSARTPAIRGDL
jgi:hypothetical protein